MTDESNNSNTAQFSGRYSNCSGKPDQLSRLAQYYLPKVPFTHSLKSHLSSSVFTSPLPIHTHVGTHTYIHTRVCAHIHTYIQFCAQDKMKGRMGEK